MSCKFAPHKVSQLAESSREEMRVGCFWWRSNAFTSPGGRFLAAIHTPRTQIHGPSFLSGPFTVHASRQVIVEIASVSNQLFFMISH